SIGDYIVTGGEIPAMAVADAALRLLPGVLKTGSAEEESFETGLLEYPQYTQPAELFGQRVPEVLCSGDHAKIAAWRQAAAVRATARFRLDLLETIDLTSQKR
ncbi:MAG: tRNA (guanosine(37)-N1)-methyltransferase TrmD, partial [Stomatobaculum longum]|nr:tRNA (guanosine(37)-N1)-methyltransferase TrmD [Stomatobaculum longum]